MPWLPGSVGDLDSSELAEKPLKTHANIKEIKIGTVNFAATKKLQPFVYNHKENE
jgi:hypothetical protein